MMQKEIENLLNKQFYLKHNSDLEKIAQNIQLIYYLNALFSNCRCVKHVGRV